MNECTWYCEYCNEGYCEHCERAVEIDGKFYCDDCAEQLEEEAKE